MFDLVSKCMCISPKVGENSSTDEGGPLALNPLETAVIFIEYQNEFTTEGGALHDDVKECMEDTGMIDNSKKVMDAARELGALIVHVPIIFEKVRLFGKRVGKQLETIRPVIL